MSPRAHLHVVGMFEFVSLDIDQPSLPTPLHSALGIYFCLYGPFNCIYFVPQILLQPWHNLLWLTGLKTPTTYLPTCLCWENIESTVMQSRFCHFDRSWYFCIFSINCVAIRRPGVLSRVRSRKACGLRDVFFFQLCTTGALHSLHPFQCIRAAFQQCS